MQIQNKRVLVVDDLDSELISFCLRQIEGVTVVAAESAADALLEIGRAPFDLYVLDGSMPVMDGFRLAEVVRAAGDETPILFVTAHMSEVTEPHAESVGACGVIEKPFRVENLIKRVSKILEQDRPDPRAPPCTDGLVM
ncbi:MAG: hypothetical protein DMF68_01605 [Acidobacteria bacterium]|nr:MAG: hypothetical protein DMF68_01605 [Acidobacteriota bacterium]